jgi:hypothetical protein
MEKIENGNIPPLQREFSVGGPAYVMDDDRVKKKRIPTKPSPLQREDSLGGPAYAMEDDDEGDKKNSIPTTKPSASSELLVAHSKARGGATTKKTNNEDDDEFMQTKKKWSRDRKKNQGSPNENASAASTGEATESKTGNLVSSTNDQALQETKKKWSRDRKKKALQGDDEVGEVLIDSSDDDDSVKPGAVSFPGMNATEPSLDQALPQEVVATPAVPASTRSLIQAELAPDNDDVIDQAVAVALEEQKNKAVVATVMSQNSWYKENWKILIGISLVLVLAIVLALIFTLNEPQPSDPPTPSPINVRFQFRASHVCSNRVNGPIRASHICSNRINDPIHDSNLSSLLFHGDFSRGSRGWNTIWSRGYPDQRWQNHGSCIE